ncbi:amino acid permease [Effusibacillus dendaii]|nr:amino acid permease [Effusibacillus dendaii]
MFDQKSAKRGALGCSAKVPRIQIGQVADQGAGQKPKGNLKASTLAMIGVGGIVGAGYFLGSGLSISVAGPGVLLAYILGAFIMSQVLGAMVSISAAHPVQGSFRVYAEQTMGPYIGYVLGWLFWMSGILGIGSEAVAMGIFSRVWWPHIPLWILSAAYAAIIFLLNAFGVKNFGRIESLMSIIKISALVGFIIAVVLAVTGLLPAPGMVGWRGITAYGGFLPHGWNGVFQSMLWVIFSYSGIGAVAMASSEVERPEKTINQAAVAVVTIILGLYLLATIGLFLLKPWQSYNADVSPFVAALSAIQIPFAGPILNVVILISAFSVMASSVFSVTVMLQSLGSSGYAPSFLTQLDRRGVPIRALLVSATGVALTIVLSYLLPSRVYSYLASVCGFITFFNWTVNLLTLVKWIKEKEPSLPKSVLAWGAPYTSWLVMVLIVVLTVYSLEIRDQRMGFYFALLFYCIVSFSYVLVRKRRKQQAG